MADQAPRHCIHEHYTACQRDDSAAECRLVHAANEGRRTLLRAAPRVSAILGGGLVWSAGLTLTVER